ncbi:hypothetical protein QF031_000952 [Pseudarthrobacter defluvii]|uniref:hypothetical protein n=1 Tax=Pseudarthrobacter defluvii TaxID=410837 RepID=UPI0027869C32|nr:hypothetical protein [Pseudarthrobacter defluvii]MDQ0768203.1 hypothetical protein [Pseudarthrobacter defluvii]
MTRINAKGFPVDDKGHRTDRPYTHKSGKKLWYPDELKFAQGERVRAIKDYGLIKEGDVGTITEVPVLTSPAYHVMPDGTEKIQRVPQDYLEAE